MIEMAGTRLEFSAPEVHQEARFSVAFQRTLRVPDDGTDYPLPAGLGEFPLEHVDDHAGTVPAAWSRHGGVMLPMHAAEAMWLHFGGGYPWAVKVAAGMVNAVSGDVWSSALSVHGGAASGKDEQDYLVLPDQPWLDGFNSGAGTIRQFVAMPLGGGYTVEEQVTGSPTYGGLQIVAYPMRAKAYEQLLDREPRVDPTMRGIAFDCIGPAGSPARGADMGLGAGGRIRQEIEQDQYGPDAWDLRHASRCFAHLARAEQWVALTGAPAPTKPPTPRQYRRAGIPWFDYASGGPDVPPSATLAGVASIEEVARHDGLGLPDNDPVPIDRVVRLGRRVRRGVSDGMWPHA